MKKNFEIIRHALEEHLSAINENTSEIQALFDYLHELEIKVDRLSERLDRTELDLPAEQPEVEPLDNLEKQVFLILYTEEMPLSYHEIAIKARLPISTIPETISSLIAKGVPLLRSLANKQLFFKLSPSFKETQAKENIINLTLHNFI